MCETYNTRLHLLGDSVNRRRSDEAMASLEGMFNKVRSTGKVPVMARVDVMVLPVSVRDVDGSPVVVGLPDPSGGWVRETSATDPAGAALRMLEELLPVPRSLLREEWLRPLPVTFYEREDSPGNRAVVLLYTASVPVAVAADENVPGNERWRALLNPAASAEAAKSTGRAMLTPLGESADLEEAVLDFWRQKLEGTAAALLFLPPYWTMPQLRDVYSGFWGYEQDAAGFGRWALKGDPPAWGADLIREKGDKLDVSAQMASTFEQIYKVASDPNAYGAIASGAAEGWRAMTIFSDLLGTGTGLSLKTGKAKLLAAALPVGALAATAALVAYQPTRRGKDPVWYSTAVQRPEQHHLAKLYQPRPGWMYAGDN